MILIELMIIVRNMQKGKITSGPAFHSIGENRENKKISGHASRNIIASI